MTRNAMSCRRGKILTPAAREYLQSRKIKIVKAGQQPQPRIVATEVPPMPEVTIPAPAPVPAPPPAPAPIKPKFVDYESGAFYMEKPEHMTHLVGNVLVVKNHPRILFRGKLDSLQSAVVLAQVDIHERGGSKALIDDLGDILNILREMMRCDVLDEPFPGGKDDRPDPCGVCGSSPMIPSGSSASRPWCFPTTPWAGTSPCSTSSAPTCGETEVAAAEAFHDGAKYTRGDIIEELQTACPAPCTS